MVYPSELMRPFTLEQTNPFVERLVSAGVDFFITDELSTATNVLTNEQVPISNLEEVEISSIVGEYRVGYDYSTLSLEERSELDADPYQVFKRREDDIRDSCLKTNREYPETYVEVPVSLDPVEDFEFVLKYRAHSTSGTDSTILSIVDSEGNADFVLYNDSNNSGNMRAAGNKPTYTGAEGNVTTTNWRILRILWDSENTILKCYIDGEYSRSYNLTDNGAFFSSVSNLQLGGSSIEGYTGGLDLSYFIVIKNEVVVSHFDFNQQPNVADVPEIIAGNNGTLVNFPFSSGYLFDENGEREAFRLENRTYLATKPSEAEQSALMDTSSYRVIFEAIRAPRGRKTKLFHMSWSGISIDIRNEAGNLTLSPGKHTFTKIEPDDGFHRIEAIWSGVDQTVKLLVDDELMNTITDIDTTYIPHSEGLGTLHRILVGRYNHINSSFAAVDLKGKLIVQNDENGEKFEFDFDNGDDVSFPETYGKNPLVIERQDVLGYQPNSLQQTIAISPDGTKDYENHGQARADIESYEGHTVLEVYGASSTESGNIADMQGSVDLVGMTEDAEITHPMIVTRNVGQVSLKNLKISAPIETSGNLHISNSTLKSTGVDKSISAFESVMSGVTSLKNCHFVNWFRAIDGEDDYLDLIVANDCVFVETVDLDVIRATVNNCIFASTPTLGNLYTPKGWQTPGAGNITRDSSAADIGNGVQREDIYTAFADGASGDYRIKQSYADANIVGQGWSGSNPAEWSYYLDDTTPLPTDTTYTLSLKSVLSEAMVNRMLGVSERAITITGASTTAQLPVESYALIERAITITGAEVENYVQSIIAHADKAVVITGMNAPVSVSNATLRRDWAQLLKSAAVDAQSVSASLLRDHVVSLRSARAETYTETISLLKENRLALKPVRAETTFENMWLARDHEVTLTGGTAVVKGQRLEMVVTELGLYGIKLKGLETSAALARTHITSEKAMALRPFNAQGYGDTMYVNVDRVINLSPLRANTLTTGLKTTYDRLVSMHGTASTLVIDAATLLYNRVGSLKSVYAAMYGSDLIMSSTGIAALVKTGRIEGYTVSFEASYVSVIYEIE